MRVVYLVLRLVLLLAALYLVLPPMPAPPPLYSIQRMWRETLLLLESSTPTVSPLPRSGLCIYPIPRLTGT